LPWSVQPIVAVEHALKFCCKMILLLLKSKHSQIHVQMP